MEAHKRMHLRKSSRKVEAMLGVTPIVLQVNIAAANKASVPRPLTTPRTRARRRRAQVCPPAISPSSSITDDDDATIINSACGSTVTLSDVNSFIWVKEDSETTPHSGYVPHSLPEAVSPSVPLKPTKRGRSKTGPKAPKAKASLLPPLPSSVRPLGKKIQEADQPVLVVQTGLNSATTPCHRKSPSEITLTNITSHAEPLSPISPRSPLTPGSTASFAQAQEREMMRKKMAKLTRTLGGNVPPELVFQGQRKLKERRASTSMPKRGASSADLGPFPRSSTSSNGSACPAAPERFERANRPRSLTVAHSSRNIPNVEIEQVVDLPIKAPSIIVEAPSTPPLPPSPSPKSQSQTKKPQTPKYASAKFTGHVSSTSAPRLAPFASIPGRSSLNVERPAFVRVPHHAPSKSISDYRTPADYVYGSNTSHSEQDAAQAEELHRRKEREWSGEWNVADMGDVMKKLRNLKGR